MVTFAQVVTDEERWQVYHLRYHVYCLERGFEDSDAFPDEMETDRWDAGSWHFVCREDDGRLIGTVRLIAAADRMLPLEQRCRITFPEYQEIRPFAAEVSRLAVLRCLEDEGGRRTPLASLGLIRAAYQKCLHEGLTHFLAAMERRLFLLLRRHGIRFRPIGPTVDYHGPRTPYVLPGWDLERECRRRRPDVYRFLREGLPPDLTAASLRPVCQSR